MQRSPSFAEAILKRSVAKFPDHKPTLQILGVVQHRLGKDDEAEVHFRKLVEMDPDNAENHANLGTALGGLKRHKEAIESMEESVKLNPKKAMFLNNLAIQYQEVGKYKDAEDVLQEALKLKQTAEVWDNLGNLYVQMENYPSAKNCYLNAIGIDEKYVPSHVSLGLVSHFMGDWKKGFEKYEWRYLYYPELRPYISWYDLSKMWDGKASLEGKRVLVYGEQGSGDIIMFSRYLKEIKARGAYVMFHIPVSLNKLFAGMKEIDEFVNVDINNLKVDPLPEYDYQFALMSAPFLLGVEAISGEWYITDTPDNFRNIIKEQCPDTINVGIVWSGNTANPDNVDKAVPLSELKRLESVEGVKLFSLQMDGKEEAEAAGLTDLSDFIQDFSDTARVIKGMDILICCDTAAAHVAGACGMTVWNLIRYGPDWRWPIRRPMISGTHWYESMTLFHQQEKGNWSKVIDAVIESLTESVNTINVLKKHFSSSEN